MSLSSPTCISLSSPTYGYITLIPFILLSKQSGGGKGRTDLLCPSEGVQIVVGQSAVCPVSDFYMLTFGGIKSIKKWKQKISKGCRVLTRTVYGNGTVD